jgi:spermidine synthase
VLSVSTLGSLLGVFSTSHLLLPGLGLQRTSLLASAALCLAGVLARWLAHGQRMGASAAVVLLVAGFSSALFVPSRPALEPGRVELASRESAYQALRVVEEHTPSGSFRRLQVNEGFDSFQSVWQEQPGRLPDGFYYNDFLLPLLWNEPTESWRVLVLGLGAGTVTRVFAGEPRTGVRFVGVELDPAVVELGREYFDLGPDSDSLQVVAGLDARVALRAERGLFEQIVLDCYSNQIEIPAHLCTLEFFRELHARLAEGGWLTANLGGFDFDDPVVTAVAQTCAQAFASPVLLVRVPQARNYMLVARRGELPWEDGTLSNASAASRFTLGPRQLPGFTRLVEPASERDCLTDDHCPIETLQLRSIAEARAKRLAARDT